MKNTHNRKQDIFDMLFTFPILRIFAPFYLNHKSVLLYLFFGGTSFFINIVLFIVLDNFTHIDVLFNNVICWIVCVLFQYYTNRSMVFNSPPKNRNSYIKQITSFFSSRVSTLIIEEAILVIFITWLSFNSSCIKLIAQVVVITLNYVLSKKIVFKKC